MDGWRAIAIIAVVICHAGAGIWGVGGTHPSSRLYDLSRYGALGVDVFFGISGFLICTRLLQEEAKRGRISLKKFYIRRAFRILPPYFLYLLALGLIALLGTVPLPFRDLLGCLLFFRNYMAGTWYTGHFWSLAVEEHFYLLWPCLLFLAGSRRSRILVPAIALAVALWRTLEFHHGFVSQHLLGASFYERTDIRIDALLWGCWAALFFHLPGWRQRLTRWTRPVVWFVVIAVYVLCVVFKPPFSMLLQGTLIPLLLIGTVAHPSQWVGRLLELRLMRLIGRISYGLYLWQQLFTASGADSFRSKFLYLQHFPWNVLAIFACASLSYYLLERRMIQTGHKLTSRRPATLTIAETKLPQSSIASSLGT